MSGVGENIFLIRSHHIFDFTEFGNFRGLSLWCYSTGYSLCAFNLIIPIPILSVRLLMILSSGWILSLISTMVLGLVSVFDLSVKMRMFFRSRDAYYISVIQL